jgi:tyrosine-protein kinase Etk/Wzc
MNNAPSTDRRSSALAKEGPYSGNDRDRSEDFNLRLVLSTLWDGRYRILGAVAFFLAVGGIYLWTTAPVYQVEGLLQTEIQKTYGGQAADFTKIEGPYALPTYAEGEIEILKSNLVLGPVVQNLRLDVSAGPVLAPVIGKLLMQLHARKPAIAVESFEVPPRLRGMIFRVDALADGGFQLKSPEGVLLGQGRPGASMTADYQGGTLQLKVARLSGQPGQGFFLVQNPELQVINDLRLGLQAEERGKNAMGSSNLLWLGLQALDPDQGARILNAILNQYIRQSIERKAGESSTALALLQKQRPELQAQVAEAEGRLNAYRSRSGTVDLVREGEIYLEQASSLENQISALQQKKQELLRTYTENSDLVATLNQQIARLRSEGRTVDSKVSTLPHTQQEFVRLTRDAQVKSDMYTSMLNSIQQLETTLAGSVGSARVVDYAIPDYDPIAPRKAVLMVLFLFIGTVVGVGLTVLRQVLQRGIEDHRIIETKLGLPILVTIPHSEAQVKQGRNGLKQAPGTHLLAVQEPDDLATESLRSLRTALHFAMDGKASRVILVAGASPRIGKSFISSNLAAVLCQAGGRVLLVDADMRNGFLHMAFGHKRSVGLSDVLSGRMPWETVVKQTGVPGLSVITTGALPLDPLVLLMPRPFEEFTALAAKAYDFVIFDAPPILAVSDALVIGAQADTVLLVAKYGVHPLDELRACMDRLKPLGARLKGCVFNDIKVVHASSRYGYYKYGYAYRYKKADA